MGKASKDGEPQISPNGSVMAFDRDTLACWERGKRSALDNVAENPQVVVYYAHAADRVRWRFHGRATVHEDGPVRQEVWSAASKPNWTGTWNVWMSLCSSR